MNDDTCDLLSGGVNFWRTTRSHSEVLSDFIHQTPVRSVDQQYFPDVVSWQDPEEKCAFPTQLVECETGGLGP